MSIDYLIESEKYRPSLIRTLLVGEAPPPSGDKYFYVPRDMSDQLPIEDDRSLPATIFNHYFGCRPRSQQQYQVFLSTLKENGLFFVDICAELIKVRNCENGLLRIIAEIPRFRQKLALRNITVPEDAIVFLLARQKYKTQLRKAFPEAMHVTWKDFRTNPATSLFVVTK